MRRKHILRTNSLTKVNPVTIFSDLQNKESLMDFITVWSIEENLQDNDCNINMQYTGPPEEHISSFKHFF